MPTNKQVTLAQVIAFSACLFCTSTMANAAVNSLSVNNQQSTGCAAIGIYQQGSTNVLMRGGYRSAASGLSGIFTQSDLQNIKNNANGATTFTIQVLQREGDCPTYSWNTQEANQATRFDLNLVTGQIIINSGNYCIKGGCNKIDSPTGGSATPYVNVHD